LVRNNLKLLGKRLKMNVKLKYQLETGKVGRANTEYAVYLPTPPPSPPNGDIEIVCGQSNGVTSFVSIATNAHSVTRKTPRPSEDDKPVTTNPLKHDTDSEKPSEKSTSIPVFSLLITEKTSNSKNTGQI